jgi:phosphoesterase RecJ-like protein
VKSRRSILASLAAALRSHKSFCVVGHVRPDGDCIGSQLALTLALRHHGRQAVCWNSDSIPDKLAFLDPDRLLTRPAPGRRFDCVIATDCASLDRLGDVSRHIQRRKLFINIDHHPSNTRYADLNWISPSSPSTGELIVRLLRFAGWTVTPPIADALFTAISTDTGSFQYPTTRPATFQAAAQLVRSGANLARICHHVYQSFPLARHRLLRLLDSRLRLIAANGIAYAWLKPGDYTRTGAGPDDTEGLIDHLRNLEPVVVACLFEQLSQRQTRISLRSKSPEIDVGKIACGFGGGGHAAAAGARIRGLPAETQRLVLNAVRREVTRNR